MSARCIRPPATRGSFHADHSGPREQEKGSPSASREQATEVDEELTRRPRAFGYRLLGGRDGHQQYPAAALDAAVPPCTGSSEPRCERVACRRDLGQAPVVHSPVSWEVIMVRRSSLRDTGVSGSQLALRREASAPACLLPPPPPCSPHPPARPADPTPGMRVVPPGPPHPADRTGPAGPTPGAPAFSASPAGPGSPGGPSQSPRSRRSCLRGRPPGGPRALALREAPLPGWPGARPRPRAGRTRRRSRAWRRRSARGLLRRPRSSHRCAGWLRRRDFAGSCSTVTPPPSAGRCRMSPRVGAGDDLGGAGDDRRPVPNSVEVTARSPHHQPGLVVGKGDRGRLVTAVPPRPARDYAR